MNAIKFIAFACLLVSVVIAAPTEVPAGQASTEASAAITTSVPSTEQASSSETPASTSAAPTTTAPVAVPTTQASTSQSAPATDASAKEQITTSPMTQPETAFNTTSFTCYGRSIGYYADIEQECKVYHFCLLGDYNGEPVYQRISYLCLNNTVFDQQALDCVEASKVTAPCKDSQTHYEMSNSILRQSIVGNKMHQGENETAKNTTASS